ncbi:hypothetical protein C2845_PM09G07190 [Panicum miliaceum]|uniref:Uncharacterized protein n=1 Tax=Panicum miliaceum TaxID=4540 RepID=A0A3L6RYW4_PANMI|nr:hypothetical protein C2845_PM09G07190 [Panicum miliaceum]
MAVESLKPHYSWDGTKWRIVRAKRQADFRRKSAPGKRTRSNKVTFSSDEHSHDPESSEAKKSRKELQQKVAVLAEGSEHASVCEMGNPLSALENSSASIDPPNSSSLLYDIDMHSSNLDEGQTAPSSGCQGNTNADALRHNTSTQFPFVKSSIFWSKIEEEEVFKEFPQRPHFLPVQQYLPGQREEEAFAMMITFNNLVKSIRESNIADNESSFEEKKCILAELKTNGFDVQYFESLLDQLTKVKFEYTKDLEEKTAIEAEKLGATSSLSRNKSLLCDIDKEMALLDQKLRLLRQKGQLIEKYKEEDEEKLSTLNEAESSVEKALHADKRQFHSRLVRFALEAANLKCCKLMLPQDCRSQDYC